MIISVYLQLLGVAAPKAQEILYPEGHDIINIYYISSSDFDLTDTIEVVRVVVNNEPYELRNLYLSENLPPQFQLVSYSLTMNEDAISCLHTGPVLNEVVPGYYSHRWIIDLPEPDDPLNLTVAPGAALELRYNLTCGEVGQFTLPLHTACYYGDTTGLFTVADSIVVTAHASACNFIPGDANNDQIANAVDIIFMVNFLKGGYPPAVTCYCPPIRSLYAACDVNGNCNFNGVDVVYYINYLKGVGSPLIYCPNCIIE